MRPNRRFGILVLAWPALIGAVGCLFSADVVDRLVDCAAAGRQFCDVDAVPNRDAINEAIERSPRLLAHYRRLAGESRRRRRRRQADDGDERRDCSSVCCEQRSETEPLSFFQDHSGWHQVASTPEHPQRTIISIAKCANLNSRCRGVSPIDELLRPTCSERVRRHRLLLYDAEQRTVRSRWLALPDGCVCTLRVKFFAETPDLPSATTETAVPAVVTEADNITDVTEEFAKLTLTELLIANATDSNEERARK